MTRVSFLLALSLLLAGSTAHSFQVRCTVVRSAKVQTSTVSGTQVTQNSGSPPPQVSQSAQGGTKTVTVNF